MRSVGALGLVLLLGGTFAAAADVRWERERLTATFQDAPVADAIAAVAEATGAELHGGVVATGTITLTLERARLEEALHRLLGAQNFTVRYGSGDRVKAIVLAGGVQEAPRVVAQASPAAGVEPPPPEKPTFPIVLSKMFNRHRPITLGGALAERIGEEKATMPKLLDAATGDDDAITRALATQQVLSALEREGRYRRSFLRTLHQLPPDELAAVASGPSGDRFRELLEFLAAHSREPTLQKKAGVVLDDLNQAVD